MKIGVILQSNKAEHIWNVFRLAIASLKKGHTATIFLMSEGVEIDDVSGTKDFDIANKVKEFKDLKGELFACETCLQVRSKTESKVCPVSTMSELVKMIEQSDKVLTFG